MKLNVDSWKPFGLKKLFSICAGKYYYKDDYSEGTTPYCSASAENNGIGKTIDISPDFDGNKIITGKVGCTAFYQPKPFCATSDVNVLTPLFEMSAEVGLFITTVINKNENYRWNYGRQCRVNDTEGIVIKLPIQINTDGTPKIDPKSNYSNNGYIPDWDWMEAYIKTLHFRPLSTNISKLTNFDANVNEWKEFLLHRIFNAGMGNGIDAIATTNDDPKFNYVGRSATNNGVAGIIDEIEGEIPFPAGAITLSLGGSIGSCFIQSKPFYTAQNVAVLQEKVALSIYTKLFITAIIKNECKIKYQAFGRELNAHFRKDFTIKLPVKRDENGLILDGTHEFSDAGYIPDWEWMEKYIKSLPFSDRI